MKRHAPATARNSGPIAERLAEELPAKGVVLEVAAGTGEHAVFLSRRFPALSWLPSDADPGALDSIKAWREEGEASNLLAPVGLDAASPDWSIPHVDAILCVNMVHISPWKASEGLFAGAGRALEAGAPLILYGPFLEEQTLIAQSNFAFDESLKSRDPQWGLRDVAALDQLSAKHGLTRSARYEMPANNLLLVWRKD